MSSTVRGVDLNIENLWKSFGKTHVLQGLNLEIRAGEFIAIVGRSGCGKSTLLRAIAGLAAPNAGSLWVDDQPVKGINPIARVMFQEPRLLPWKKVYQNVSLGLPKESRIRARWALAQVGLSDRASEFPSILSGGQKQRVALARALVSEPRLMLLDEPLGALDALTRIEMQNLLENLWLEQKFTALLITHDVEEAVALCDRLILIENGQIGLDLKIDLPRPRSRGSAEFAALVDKIRTRVMNPESISQFAAQAA
ncbi:ABC transporter ATP-binding protein [Pseudanabaena sp. ABRG5-3]|uniref:ABC transporter ATP-binding protein n=1 Tax=Pseudanabaena sp. ABRG5-3 TaxID=685565 RepID=UPI000DC705C2|nr:ATP-binding cassette domain-containing protein [Pseudanabaena sp. ABRG5-3]BBC26900.1 aliphatic sulfonate ABC transporter ATP-binding protein [Pseudanabaena sp. ABRG5-3]